MSQMSGFPTWRGHNPNRGISDAKHKQRRAFGDAQGRLSPSSLRADCGLGEASNSAIRARPNPSDPDKLQSEMGLMGGGKDLVAADGFTKRISHIHPKVVGG